MLTLCDQQAGEEIKKMRMATVFKKPDCEGNTRTARRPPQGLNKFPGREQAGWKAGATSLEMTGSMVQ